MQGLNKIVKKTLSNGVKVYFYKDSSLKRIFMTYNVNYGSHGYFNNIKLNGKKVTLPFGMAHFLEHTLIEHSYKGNMLHNYLNKNYDFNGMTKMETTTYIFIGRKKYKEAIKDLINIVDNPVFTSDDIEHVKNAVCEELKQGNDNRYSKVFHLNKRNLYSNYEVVDKSLCNIGTVEDTMKFDYDIVKTAYDAYYRDDNKYIVLGGNFNIDEMTDYLEEIYKDIKPHKAKVESLNSNEFKIRKKEDVLYDNINTEFNIITFKEKYNPKKDVLKQDLAIHYINGLLFDTDYIDKLNDEKIITGTIARTADFFNGVIELSYYADVYDSKKFYDEIINRLKNGTKYIKEKDFELIKKQLLVREIRSYDYMYEKLHNYTDSMLFTEEIDVTDIIRSVTLDDIKKELSNLKLDVYSKTSLKIKEEN